MRECIHVLPILPNNSIPGLRRVALLALCIGLIFAAIVLVVQARDTPSNTSCEGCVLPPVGLIGWWPGDGNAIDIQLGNNGTLMNGAGFIFSGRSRADPIQFVLPQSLPIARSCKR